MVEVLLHTAWRQIIAELNPEALSMDGFDDAIIGIAERCGQPALLVYDRDLCIEVLVKGGMSEQESLEYFDFNCAGAYVGPHTPLIMTRL
jgi:hypothetical protein